MLSHKVSSKIFQDENPPIIHKKKAIKVVQISQENIYSLSGVVLRSIHYLIIQGIGRQWISSRQCLQISSKIESLINQSWRKSTYPNILRSATKCKSTMLVGDSNTRLVEVRNWSSLELTQFNQQYIDCQLKHRGTPSQRFIISIIWESLPTS